MHTIHLNYSFCCCCCSYRECLFIDWFDFLFHIFHGSIFESIQSVTLYLDAIISFVHTIVCISQCEIHTQIIHHFFSMYSIIYDFSWCFRQFVTCFINSWIFSIFSPIPKFWFFSTFCHSQRHMGSMPHILYTRTSKKGLVDYSLHLIVICCFSSTNYYHTFYFFVMMSGFRSVYWWI